MYERSKIRLAVSRATCRPLHLAAKQSRTRSSAAFTEGSWGQPCRTGEPGWPRKQLQLSSSVPPLTPQPHCETKSDHLETRGEPGGTNQQCPYTTSVRTSSPSWLRERATDSRERQNPSATRRYWVWEQPRALTVLAGRLQLWKGNQNRKAKLQHFHRNNFKRVSYCCFFSPQNRWFSSN